ncbi:hypothetical protein DM46_2711 [Burkholderia mallei]|nr:hypothetical protein DM46_2711 [Burkholderia mallei]
MAAPRVRAARPTQRSWRRPISPRAPVREGRCAVARDGERRKPHGGGSAAESGYRADNRAP